MCGFIKLTRFVDCKTIYIRRDSIVALTEMEGYTTVHYGNDPRVGVIKVKEDPKQIFQLIHTSRIKESVG